MLETPFADVVFGEDGFSIPDLKWREMLFTGAMRSVDNNQFVRDVTRPLPAFQVPDLFPSGVRFQVRKEGGRVHLKRI